MKHILEDLQALIGSRKIVPLHGPRAETARSVVMRVTLDARHATPLRQALIRDCAGQPWTIRVTPLRGTDRVRLVLYLPRSA
ncbi:hypothetical protein [Burkholderia sp. PU8-34]